MNYEEVFRFASDTHAQHPDRRGVAVPYGLHLLRVAARVRDLGESAVFSSFMHDLVEDTPVTISDLEKLGFDDETIQMVFLASRNMFPDMTFDEWTEHIATSENTKGIALKVADVSDNLSGERMNYLFFTDKTKIKPPRNLAERLFNLSDGRQKLGGEGGLHFRYYDVLAKFCREHPELAMFSRQFGDFDDYAFARNIASKNEFSLLGKITGGMSSVTPLEIIRDKNGNEYLVASPNRSICDIYRLRAEKMENGLDMVKRQQERDDGTHHVTILNAKEFGQTRKRFGDEIVFPEEIRMSFYGVGMANEETNSAIYAIAGSGQIDSFRHSLGFASKDLHMTLGFNKKDIHRSRKDNSSTVVNFEDVILEMDKAPIKRPVCKI